MACRLLGSSCAWPRGRHGKTPIPNAEPTPSANVTIIAPCAGHGNSVYTPQAVINGRQRGCRQSNWTRWTAYARVPPPHATADTDNCTREGDKGLRVEQVGALRDIRSSAIRRDRTISTLLPEPDHLCACAVKIAGRTADQSRILCIKAQELIGSL